MNEEEFRLSVPKQLTLGFGVLQGDWLKNGIFRKEAFTVCGCHNVHGQC